MVEPLAPAAPLARRLRAAFAAVAGPRSDGDLLARFVAARDEEAFTELVRRLGPTVLGVCRRVLGPTPDADDAFQAAFLVLARKADTIRPPGKVAAWLYGVAALTARKARFVRARRLAREAPVAELPDRPAPEVVAMDPDLGPAVDDELTRLPDRLRLPLLLCAVRRLTTAQAAAELGWPVGTVASRLSRGRAVLADRLTRRGITAGAAVAAAGGLGRAATAGVPERLVAETVAAAVAGACPSAAVLSLTREVFRAMTVSKIRLLTAGLLASAAVALTGGTPSAPRAVAAPVPAAASKEPDPVDRVKLPDPGPLLQVEAVQKDLGLGEADAKRLTDAWRDGLKAQQAKLEAMVRQQVLARQNGGGVVTISVPGDSEKLVQERIDEFNKKVTAELKPEQVRRLKQIVLQADGPHALLDRRVIRGLGLSAEQEDKIDALLPPRRTRYIPKTDYARAAEELDAALKETEKVLTPEQRKKWGAITGKRLTSEDLVRGHPLAEDALNTSTFTVRAGVALPLPAAPAQPPPEKKDKE